MCSRRPLTIHLEVYSTLSDLGFFCHFASSLTVLYLRYTSVFHVTQLGAHLFCGVREPCGGGADEHGATEPQRQCAHDERVFGGILLHVGSPLWSIFVQPFGSAHECCLMIIMIF